LIELRIVNMNNPTVSFYKTEIYIAEQMAALTHANKTASVVLYILIAAVLKKNNPYGALMISNKDLAFICNYKTTRSVVLATRFLIDSGFIGRSKHGRNNVYIINPDILSVQKEHNTSTDLDRISVHVNDEQSAEFIGKMADIIRKAKAIRNRAMMSDNVETAKMDHKPTKRANNIHLDEQGNEFVITASGERMMMADFI